MRKFRLLSIPAALALTIAGSAAVPGSQHVKDASQPIAGPVGDFNGDSFADLAVGAPFEDVGGRVDAGAVNVIYGSSSGLTAAGSQYWTQDSASIGDSAENNDQFGFAAAAGDFNDDGFSDLAVGVPLEDTPNDSGVVNVIYGSAAGLTATGNQVWSQNSAGIADTREAEDNFGHALAAADFDGDGFVDLAIGVHYENLTSHEDAGAVNVIYGSPSGLTSGGNQFWHQGSPGIDGSPERGDYFAFSLAAGDFDGDGFGDLALGVPGEDSPLDYGVVNVIYGSDSGLTAAGNQVWSQNSRGIQGTGEAFDFFGYAVTAGDFGGDGFDDLAVGIPFEDLGTKANAGGVTVIYGTSSGLRATANQFWSQDSSGIVDKGEARDQFGFALAAGDFNGDQAGDVSDDLAIGVPGEDLPTNAGRAAVIYAGSLRLSSAGNQLWSQNGLSGSTSETWDAFGFSLKAGNFGNGTAIDLAIGVAFEDVGTTEDAGAMNAVYGSPEGLRTDGNQYWTQDDIIGPAERGDRFGYAVGGQAPG
ncbi:MAG: hypothetical protein ACRDHO_01130 [Actinomycetota bacterium]